MNEFREFLEALMERSPGGVAGIIFYVDEVQPGNPLRADSGRKRWAAYIQLAHAPPWARSATATALSLAIVRTQELNLLGGLSGAQSPAGLGLPAAVLPRSGPIACRERARGF